MDSNQEFSLYKDMKARTNGEIYIGAIGRYMLNRRI